MTTRITTILLVALISSWPAAGMALADTTVLSPSKDNTLYESAIGENSNALGPTMFAGKTFQGYEDLRRAVIAFDLSAIPGGSTITAAELRLYESRTARGALPVTIKIHRLTADWGEGTSMADSSGGFGVHATPGDATWLHRFYDLVFWNTPGGDFQPTSSAWISVGGVGFYTWGSTPAMVADVQAWLDNSATNFGWIVIGNESSPGSARRFNTREHTIVLLRPVLTLTYEPPYVPVESTTWGRVKALYAG